MPFFEVPETPPGPAFDPDEPYVAPIWTGPSVLLLGGAVPVNLLLARTDRVAVVAERVVAYPNGCALTVVIRARDPMDHGMNMHAVRVSGNLRLGVQFADGRKAATVGAGSAFACPRDDAGIPTEPVLMMQGGGGGNREWRQDLWLWPLPPRGPLALVVEWPMLGIPETRHEIDAGPIVDAAERTVTLWESARAHPADGSTSTMLGPLPPTAG